MMQDTGKNAENADSITILIYAALGLAFALYSPILFYLIGGFFAMLF